MLSSEAPGARKRGPPAAATAPPTLSDLEAEPLSVEPAAKKPARRYASRGAGFSGQETAALLALLQAQLPVSKDEWEAIARMHAVRFPTLNRTADTLRRKFARLNQSSRADDQPRVSREAKLARAIHSAINKRSQFGDDGAGPPVDLIDPLGSEHDATEQFDDDEDDQPLTMQQPTTLQQPQPLRPQQQLEQQAQVQQIPMAPVRPPPVPEQQPSQQQRQALPTTAATPSLPAAAANPACSTCHVNASKWDELLVMMRVSMLAMQQQREQDAADRRRRDEEERARREEDRRRWEEQREADRERSQRLLDAMGQTHKTIELLVAAVVTNQRRE